MWQKTKSSKNGYSSYPTTLMLVSNTETAMSWSKVACWMTSWTPFSNSSMSPRTTNVSKESIRVSVKLRGENQCIDFSCSTICKYGMKRLKEIPTNDGETIIENLWNVRTVEKKRLTFQERHQYLHDWVRGHETDLDSSVASIRLQEMHFPYRHGKHDKTCHVPLPWKNGGKRQFEKLNFKGTFGMMNEFYCRN